MKMIISAGGTGGHIYPALAIIEYFKKHDKNFEVLYIGTHDRMENTIVKNMGIPYKSIKIYGLNKKNLLKNIKNIYYLVKSYNECIKIIKEFKPDIVVGVGGYVTMPLLMSSVKLHVKCCIHEQNSIPGKTNKFLSKSMDLVFLSFESSRKYFPNTTKMVVSGNPCADNVLTNKIMKKESIGLSKDKKLLLITSGSLGSSTFNNKIIDYLKYIDKLDNIDYEVLFITGNNSYESIISSNKFSSKIKILPYLDNLSSIYKNTDLIISRAGAGTVFEILNAKVPSILVPSPYVSNNHQYYNALSLTKDNLAIMIEEDNLNKDLLYNTIKDLFKSNSEKYRTIKINLLSKKNICSSEIIYKEINNLVNKK